MFEERILLDLAADLPPDTGSDGPPVAELTVGELPESIWAFESATIGFRVKNLGLAALAGTGEGSDLVGIADLHGPDGRFLRRAAARTLPVTIPEGESRVLHSEVSFDVLGGDYQLRLGLHRAVPGPDAAPRLEPLAIATTPQSVTVKNTIYEMFVELVNKCNFRCSFCPQGDLQRVAGSMDFGLATKIVRDLAAMGHHHPIRCHLLGEPLLYRRFFDFVNMAHDHGQQVNLTTNGSLFHAPTVEKIFESRLDELLISLNTPEEETYLAQRGSGVPFQRYVDGIARMVAEVARRGPPPATRINVLFEFSRKDDPEELARLRNILALWGDVVRGAGIRNVPGPESLDRIAAPYTTLIPLAPGLDLQFNNYHSWGEGRVGGGHFCVFPWKQLAILTDGQATACCVDAEGEIHLGDARTQTIEEIWNGPRLERLRANFLRESAVEPRCQRCDVCHVKRDYLPEPA